MLGLFLQDDAVEKISAMDIDPLVKHHAIDVIENGFTVIKGAFPPEVCKKFISDFKRFAELNDDIFAANRDKNGHYPRIVNLHMAMNGLIDLFSRNNVLLAVEDLLFGAPTSLYTTLFYEIGSQQPLHRDTPVFCTRPEYLYFGNTVYLEDANDENGCLEVLRGGHKLPELDREAMAIKRYGSLDAIPAQDGEAWIEYQNAVVAQGAAAGLKSEKVYVNAGDALIWHPQLPHGGSAIKDIGRTRFSLVMHTTPHQVPVYHQNVFFNPSRAFPEQPAWSFFEWQERQIANQNYGVSFDHVSNYPLPKFKPLPVEGQPARAKRWGIF